MDGRVNEESGFFEVFYGNKWVILDEDNWNFVRKEVSMNFLWHLFCRSDFNERAIGEIRRRIKYEFDLKSLWIFFIEGNRFIGDLALNEIYERSENRYALPKDRNR